MAAVSLPLLKGGRVSLEEALDSDMDMLTRLSYYDKRDEFFSFAVFEKLSEIQALVSRHLQIPQSAFRIGVKDDRGFNEWIHGSFNLCVPIYILQPCKNLPSKLYIRFPLPYRVGEEHYPGNAEEKLRCEAATYIWIQRTTDIPIPRLLAFGFPGTQSFTAVENETIYHQILWCFRYGAAWLTGSILPPYFSHHRDCFSDTGYLIIECVDKGEMLSESWKEHRADQAKRANLFRGLSRIMLSLAECPLPRIGSWTMDDRGIITLTNRPLISNYHMRENAQIPTDIPRSLTYTSTLPYYTDLLHVFDNCLRHQPNAIHDEADGKYQMATLAGMRAVLALFTKREHRNGPFVFALTDLHQSNIFVDDDWNITKIIDLEWACSRPLEMLCPPVWLTDQDPDQIALNDPEKLYPVVHGEFIDTLQEEEMARYGSAACAQLLRENWKSGTFWYLNALDFDLSTMVTMFSCKIAPKLTWEVSGPDEHFNDVFSLFWDRRSIKFLADKAKDQEDYNDRLRRLFAEATAKRAAEETAKGTAEGIAQETIVDEPAAETVAVDNHGADVPVVEASSDADADVTNTAVSDGAKLVEGQIITDYADMEEGGQTKREETGV